MIHPFKFPSDPADSRSLETTERIILEDPPPHNGDSIHIKLTAPVGLDTSVNVTVKVMSFVVMTGKVTFTELIPSIVSSALFNVAVVNTDEIGGV